MVAAVAGDMDVADGIEQRQAVGGQVGLDEAAVLLRLDARGCVLDRLDEAASRSRARRP